MSDVEIPDGGEAEDFSPDEGVAEESVETAPVEEAEPQYDFLEVDDTIRGKYVSAKIDGKDVPVQFDELVNSYSRESVSTQRFQEAAQIRQEAENALRLSQALQANPGLTIQYLAQQAGVPVEEFVGMSPQQQQAATEAAPAEDEYMDPLERQLAEQAQMLQTMQSRIEQRDADEQLHSAVGRLKAAYQIDDNQARAVVGQAVQMNLGPEAFGMIYESMAYQASQQATAQLSAAQEAENQRRRQGAAQAQQVIAQDPGVPTSSTTQETAANFTSVRDAATAALEGLGIA